MQCLNSDAEGESDRLTEKPNTFSLPKRYETNIGNPVTNILITEVEKQEVWLWK
jgi:hypothetical protein